jgi:hypothetical protein
MIDVVTFFPFLRTAFVQSNPAIGSPAGSSYDFPVTVAKRHRELNQWARL